MNTITTLVNIPVYTSIENIQTSTHENMHLQELKVCIIQGWPLKKEDVAKA